MSVIVWKSYTQIFTVYVLVILVNAMILKMLARSVCRVNNGECQDELLFYSDLNCDVNDVSFFWWTSTFSRNTNKYFRFKYTSIEGGYTGGATTYESGSTSTSTTSNSSSSNIKSAPPTASAPSYNSMTQDVCAVGGSLGSTNIWFGISGGKHFIDKNCERLKLARILNDFGMRVAAVAILCQDPRVFESMISSRNRLPNRRQNWS